MKLNALKHPKMLDFASRLDVTRPTALGHLELLWAFASEMAPQGNIGKWSDGAIARACDWMGDPQVFMQSLLQSGLIDADLTHRYVVHDWSDHAPGWVRAKLKKVGLYFISSERTSEPSSDGSNGGSSDPPEDDLERSSESSEVDFRDDSTPPESALKSTSEPSIQEKGREEKRREVKGRVLPNHVEPERSTANGSEPVGVGKIPTDAIQRVFEHWRTVHDHPRANLDEKRRKLIAKALHAYSEADLCQSISGYRNSPHHMGQNDRATVYDSIELLLRDAGKIDAGMKFYAEPPRTNLSAQTRRIIEQTEDWEPPETRAKRREAANG